MSLGWKVAVRSSLLFVFAAAVLFLPAGTLRFWQGWACLAAYFLPAMSVYLYFLRHDRALVERRMRDREQASEQKQIIRWFKLLFLAAFLVPGFDFRLGWSRALAGDVPLWLTVLALAMIVAGFLFVAWVLKVNSFAGRTIVVETGQKVISSGPYAVVRHPMYLGSVVLFIFTPMALGSWVALPVFALLIPFYVLRLLNEEKVLRKELPGYPEYCLHTRFHLIPLVW